MHEHGLRPPALQVVIADADGPFARVDHYWEECRTVGEADGAVKYTSPAALFEEKQREDRLRDLGLSVVRYTWREMYEHPVLVMARFERAFARARRSAA
jgi:very-short-patch-repair endonuclease